MLRGLGGGCKKSVVLIYSLEVQRLFLECFFRKHGMALVRASNQEFQVTILLMVFDFQGIVCLYALHAMYTHHIHTHTPSLAVFMYIYFSFL